MKVCQSCVFTPPNSPFFVKILFMFEAKPVGNLILWMTSFTSFLCWFFNNHGGLFWSSNPYDLFEYRITLHIAWLASWMSVQFLTIFSLSLSSRLFLARNESGDIIKKCTEISQISNNITEIYQRWNHKQRYTIIHDSY